MATSKKRVTKVVIVRKRPTFTARTINRARFFASLLILTALCLLLVKSWSLLPAIEVSLKSATDTAQDARETAQSAKSTADDARKIAAASDSAIGKLQRNFDEVKIAITDLPAKNNEFLKAALDSISAKTETEAISMRKEISMKLSASEQSIADIRKSALAELEAAKTQEKARVRDTQPQINNANQSSAMPPEDQVALSYARELPGKEGQLFLKGGASRSFTKKEYDQLDIKISPVPGVKATIIHKKGSFRESWDREVDVPPSNESFKANDDELLLIAFHSNPNVPFWLTWKKKH